MANGKQKCNHKMTLDHIGFAVFFFFLLIAPKIPVHLIGGSERSSISLGFIGFIIWFLLRPSYLLRFPWQPLPVLILINFAFYGLLISLMSINMISIIYGSQFFFYVIASSIFFRVYILKAKASDSINTILSIFLIIMVIYAAGALTSVFTGPIYPWQTVYTLRPWGDMWISQGVGFSEGQNMTAEVLMIFITYLIYLFKGSKIKKTVLILLALIALFSTLCRSPIIAFFASNAILMLLDFSYALIVSGKISKIILSNLLHFACILTAIFLGIGGLLWSLNRHLFEAIVSGFGFGSSATLFPDFNTRWSLWIEGICSWASSSSIVSVIFGSGFRTSMSIVSETGAWHTSHNFFITVLDEFGIVGLSIIILFIVASAIRDLQTIYTGNNSVIFNNNITLGDLSRFRFVSILAIMIHNLAGEFLYSPVLISLLLFVLILGSFNANNQYSETQVAPFLKVDPDHINQNSATTIRSEALKVIYI